MRIGMACVLALVTACGGDDDGLLDGGPRVDAGSGETDAGMGVDAGPLEDAGPPADAGPPVDAGPGADAGPAGEGEVVINEIQASSPDWVEVANIGDAPMDLSGWILTQVDDAGDPEPDRSNPWPAGYELGPGEHFVVVVGLDAPVAGLQTECEDVEGVTECLQAEFGISNSDGDTLVLLDDEGTEVDRVEYPVEAAGSDETWGRIDDAFTVTVPTPGATNATE